MTNRDYLNTLDNKNFALVVDNIMFQCLSEVLLMKASKLQSDRDSLKKFEEEAKEAGFTDLDNLGIFKFYKWLEEEYDESN